MSTMAERVNASFHQARAEYAAKRIGTCSQCGDPVTTENAAFEDATRTCFECWTDSDMGETGYEGDGI